MFNAKNAEQHDSERASKRAWIPPVMSKGGRPLAHVAAHATSCTCVRACVRACVRSRSGGGGGGGGGVCLCMVVCVQ